MNTRLGILDLTFEMVNALDMHRGGSNSIDLLSLAPTLGPHLAGGTMRIVRLAPAHAMLQAVSC